jgi:AcrR family transcriptional regulator
MCVMAAVMQTSARSAGPAAPKRPRVPKRDPAHYHHGDLRAALLAAAEQVLLDRGVDGFTLRECARRAGVSHAAPAHHFGDARGLLTEFAALGFERLAGMMQAARDAAGANARNALLSVGRAYVLFAATHPAQFALMFRSQVVAVQGRNPHSSGKSAYDHLRETLAAARGTEVVDTPEFQTRVMLAWSAVHGLSSLILDGGLAGPDHNGSKSSSKTSTKITPVALAHKLAPAMLDALWPALVGKDAGNGA